MSEDEFVSDYNERVLEIANESVLLREKIPESKIVHKVLRSLPGKFDMKVTTIEETHDITKLKLDELFGSLLTFKMAISHRENKKGKGIAFKSIYEEETIVNQFDNEANMNESIALLTKQFSKVVKKFKNLNTTESNARNLTNYRRREMVNAIPEGLMKSLTGGLVTMDEKRMVKEEFSDVENVGELVIIMLNVLRS